MGGPSQAVRYILLVHTPGHEILIRPFENRPLLISFAFQQFIIVAGRSLKPEDPLQVSCDPAHKVEGQAPWNRPSEHPELPTRLARSPAHLGDLSGWER